MEERVTKQGYSIWSLLVIMTLLAVWLAVPRTLSIGKCPQIVLVFLIVLHQIAFWALVGSLIAFFNVRFRLVICLLTVLTTIFGILVTAEHFLLRSNYVIALTVQSGLAGVVYPIYKAVTEAFIEAFTYGPH